MTDPNIIKAYLIIRSRTSGEEQERVGLSDVSESSVEEAMRSIASSLDDSKFYIDDSEVEEVREREE